MSTISSTASSSSTTQSNSEKQMDNFIGTRDDFLTILLAQLKHQDPLDPMKGTEFIDSITRLSSVEQGINQNATLERIEELLGGGSKVDFGSPVSYLDKEIEFSSPVFNLKNGAGEFSYNLESSPKDVFIVIHDSNGKTVRTASGSTDLGKNVIKWDGLDNNGNKVKDGEYFVSVAYTQDSGVVTEVDTATSGIVTGATFEGGKNILLVNNIKVDMDKLISVKSTTQLAGN